MKNAEATRLMMLQKAFELICEKGYTATSIDDILATTQVTKGAFYCHFKYIITYSQGLRNRKAKSPLKESGFRHAYNEGAWVDLREMIVSKDK